MPKGYCRDPDESRRRILFGDDKTPVRMEKMSKDLKIGKTTLFRYRRYPSTIPFERLIRIVRWRGLTDEQIRGLFE